MSKKEKKKWKKQARKGLFNIAQVADRHNVTPVDALKIMMKAGSKIFRLDKKTGKPVPVIIREIKGDQIIVENEH